MTLARSQSHICPPCTFHLRLLTQQIYGRHKERGVCLYRFYNMSVWILSMFYSGKTSSFPGDPTCWFWSLFIKITTSELICVDFVLTHSPIKCNKHWPQCCIYWALKRHSYSYFSTFAWYLSICGLVVVFFFTRFRCSMFGSAPWLCLFRLYCSIFELPLLVSSFCGAFSFVMGSYAK